ncbi:ArsR family transcriptional regulator [Lactonifactor longoviformis]|uniref:Predicted transcriptional regulator n=1 Tax=Lactonifactor longoviformis DSM 17459 TaxID=1122155 RepID=A0A1M4YSV4_9CLOT|nr:helix-turn-helix domain-containing protein [Lactonifactor longoviformis]POP31359.1 ArsR family transcriptional regulator [Lactonifactor longoviformis]SHF08865.1 Predicted transcriptional regulator [Lactonifactor longoviformis DSM 17459]
MKLYLDFDKKKELCSLGKALSSEVRIEILKLLEQQSLNVNEIAERLEIPASSAAMNVRVLEDAGLIRTELKPGVRGSMKICSKQCGEVEILLKETGTDAQVEVINMPVGNYVDYEVSPTCGMVNDTDYIDGEDEPRCFYNPLRTTAQLIWFGAGYVEYRFSNAGVQKKVLKMAELSAELCSETADYDLDCPSDITLWLNGIDAGTYYCPSDFGGRRGKLNPDWWEDKNTQFGVLKTWRIDETGTYLDDVKVSDCRIEEYRMTETPYISVRIGIKKEAEHIGGVNIFGSHFGDHPQDIRLKLHY